MFDDEYDYSYKKKYIIEPRKSDKSKESIKASKSNNFPKLIDKKYAEDTTLISFSPNRKKIKYYNETLLQVRHEDKSKLQINGDTYILFEYIIAFFNSLIWYFILYYFETDGETNMVKHFNQVRVFYLSMSVILISCLVYQKYFSNNLLKFIGLVIYFVVECANYIGVLYFLVRISYDYTIRQEDTIISDIAYYWLSYNYLLFIVLIILIINKLIDALYSLNCDRKED
jgi:hypothetical protein